MSALGGVEIAAISFLQLFEQSGFAEALCGASSAPQLKARVTKSRVFLVDTLEKKRRIRNGGRLVTVRQNLVVGP